MKKKTVTVEVVVVASAVLIGLIAYAYLFAQAYAIDGVVLLALLLALFASRSVLHLHPLTFGSVGAASALHLMGAFGFYLQSPLVVAPWDVFVRVVWGFASLTIVYTICHPYIVIPTERVPRVATYLVLFAAAVGLGSMVEIIEVGGSFVVGEAPGIFGHDASDQQTLIGNGEWFNTVFDIAATMVGALIGLGVMLHHRKRMRLPMKVVPIEQVQNQ